ncbi:MAG: hypothetical protein AAGI66_00160 [Cyanobacteria bacterium P01_H01_bin.74]
MGKKEDKTQNIVMKAKKRRYDGGSEVSLIEMIERRKTDDEKKAKDILASNPLIASATEAKSAPKSFQPNVDLKSKKNKPLGKVSSALVKGPLQICIGIVGVFTSVLGIYVFQVQKQDKLAEQSKVVFKECLASIQKGCLDTLKSPFIAAKSVLFKN